MSTLATHPPLCDCHECNAEAKKQLDAAIEQQRNNRMQHKLAAVEAKEAMEQLCQAMVSKTGQAFKLRALLYSLWNGKPATLSDVLCLDWFLRMQLVAVISGFGYEGAEVKFFYDDMKATLDRHNLMTWFIEEGGKTPAYPKGRWNR